MASWRTQMNGKWPYMLSATLLSILLWVAVSADRVDQRTVTTDLVIANSDRRYLLTQQMPETETVEVTFTGPVGDLTALFVARPQIFIPIDSVESLELEVRLGPEMVTGRGGRELSDYGIDVRVVSVRPDRVHLQFQPRAQKVVPVVPVARLSFAAGFVLADSVRAEPGAVAVDGPEVAVARIDSVWTVPVSQQRLRASVTIEALLVLPQDDELLELSLSSVRLRVTVEPRSERAFPGVPVSVRGVGSANVRVEPSLIDVRLSGPQSAVESVRPEALSPWLQLGGTRDLGKMMQINLDPPGPFLQVQIDPDSARVTRTGDSRG